MTDTQPPYVKIPHEILARRDLTLAAKCLYAVLKDRIGRNGVCWPGVRRLAADLGMTQPTVIRARRELERHGLISTAGGAGGRTNRYSLCDGAKEPLASGAKEPLAQEAPPVLNNLYPLAKEPLAASAKEPLAKPLKKPTKEPTAKALPKPTKQSFKEKKKPSQLSAEKARPSKTNKTNATQQAIKVWMDTYKEACGQEADRPDGRIAGKLKRFIQGTVEGNLDEFKLRVRCAAGLDDRTPPWPFDQPGELTLDGIMRHWDKLGDALKRPGSKTDDPWGYERTPWTKAFHEAMGITRPRDFSDFTPWERHLAMPERFTKDGVDLVGEY